MSRWGRMPAGLVALALAGTSVASRTAVAKPTIWTRVRDPSAARLADALAEVDDLLVRAARTRRAGTTGATLRQMILRDAARRLATLAEQHPRDGAVQWRLARVELDRFGLDADRRHLETAISSLRAAVATRLPEPTLAEAWNDLAIAFARLGRHREEIAAYDEALRHEPHPEDRGVLRANRAEGLMALGEIRAAVAGYRAAIASTPSYALAYYGVTTWWGLAVALDRSGDLAGAMAQIQLARAYDPQDRRLTSDSWFYLPDYDRHWYAALGSWYDARRLVDRKQRLEAFEWAAQSWSAYLDRAPETDGWRETAAARLRQCERERRSLLATGAGR